MAVKQSISIEALPVPATVQMTVGKMIVEVPLKDLDAETIDALVAEFAENVMAEVSKV